MRPPLFVPRRFELLLVLRDFPAQQLQPLAHRVGAIGQAPELGLIADPRQRRPQGRQESAAESQEVPFYPPGRVVLGWLAGYQVPEACPESPPECADGREVQP